MRATDLPLLVTVSQPTIDPRGGRVVYAATRPDLDADAYTGQLWSAPLADGAPRRITRGFRDTSPRFSPDGDAIAFLRAEPGQPPQLHVVDAAGGEPLRITDAKLGVAAFRWSPDGRSIAFRSRTPGHGRYGTVEGITAPAEPARRITTRNWRMNGVGYTIDRRARVHLVEVPPLDAEPVLQAAPSAEDAPGGPERRPEVPEARLVTDADADFGAFCFTPDGSELLVVGALHDTADTDLRQGVYAYSTTDAEAAPRVVVDPAEGLSIVDVAIGFDGRPVLLANSVGESGRDFVARTVGLFRLGPDGGVRRLTDEETIDFGEPGSSIALHGDRVLARNRTRGRVELLAVDRDGEIETLIAGSEVLDVDAVGGTIVAVVADPGTTGELVVLEGAGARRLSDHSAPLREAGIRAPEELTVTTRDGAEVHGWVVRPDGPGPHPTLLMIHGGPYAQYSVHLFDEAQVLAAAGYAVVYGNPRGSAGYGMAHGRVIRQAMGTLDASDVLDLLDGALAADASLDASRLGILGGSYGGYLTAWTIAHDHRFAAAVVERGYLDPAIFVGTSDIGDFFTDEYVGTDAEATERQSPQAFVDRVRTPTLVVHSEQDLRCPLPQAERYYLSLRRAGVPSELLVFPGEDHELSRSGRPRHRVQRFDAIVEWFGRHLPIGG